MCFVGVGSVPVLVSVVSFAVFVAFPENVLTPTIAFTSVSLFAVLRMPLVMLPQVIGQFASSGVSLKRIQDFLLSKESPNDTHKPIDPEEASIHVEDASFKWAEAGAPTTVASKAPQSPTGKTTKKDVTEATLLRKSSTTGAGDAFKLRNVSFDVMPGKLTCVVGMTGSGKSSLISALLGDMSMTDGILKRRGKTAYVPQQSWIFNATIRENILFGKEYGKVGWPLYGIKVTEVA